MRGMSRTDKITYGPQDEVYEGGYIKWNPSFEIEISNPANAIGRAKLDVVYDHTLHRYACTAIAVEHSGEGSDITGTALRDMRIAETVQSAALQNIWVEASAINVSTSLIVMINGEAHVSAADALRKLPKAPARSTDTDARNAAIAHAIADVSGRPVLKTISEALDKSQSTAQRLIKRARDLGYLDSQDNG